MIYVTGDLHGDPARLSDKALRRLKKGDTLLVCGDFGFVWDGSPAELKLRRKIGKQKYTTIFVDGTHDNLPMIREFPEEELNKPLSDLYLMGYDLQRNAFFARKETSNTDEEE